MSGEGRSELKRHGALPEAHTEGVPNFLALGAGPGQRFYR